MKLILVTPEFDPERGGVGRYLHDLYGGLPQDRVLVIQDNSYVSHWLRAIPRLWKRLRAYPEAVLHISHVLPLGTVALALHLLTGRRYIVSLHGMDYFSALGSSRKKFLLRWILKFSSGITVNTEALAGAIELFSGRGVFVLPPSLPVMNSSDYSERRAAGLRLLVVARLVERKGIDTIISALHMLPGASLTIVGDGPDRMRLEKLAGESGVLDCITFLGQISDDAKRNVYLTHDVFVMPTREIGADKEGFGIVYLEAQYFGLPVVGGEGIGVAEAIHPDLRRYAVRHTAETLRDAIIAATSHAPKPQQLRSFAERFDSRTQSQRFWKWLKSV
jgi:phosphatidylinositol alpha-1,6-mannosyltransferase